MVRRSSTKKPGKASKSASGDAAFAVMLLSMAPPDPADQPPSETPPKQELSYPGLDATIKHRSLAASEHLDFLATRVPETMLRHLAERMFWRVAHDIVSPETEIAANQRYLHDKTFTRILARYSAAEETKRSDIDSLIAYAEKTLSQRQEEFRAKSEIFPNEAIANGYAETAIRDIQRLNEPSVIRPAEDLKPLNPHRPSQWPVRKDVKSPATIAVEAADARIAEMKAAGEGLSGRKLRIKIRRALTRWYDRLTL
jgi:hypothetical protein